MAFLFVVLIVIGLVSSWYKSDLETLRMALSGKAEFGVGEGAYGVNPWIVFLARMLVIFIPVALLAFFFGIEWLKSDFENQKRLALANSASIIEAEKDATKLEADAANGRQTLIERQARIFREVLVDSEIETLKKRLTNVERKQSSWGQTVIQGEGVATFGELRVPTVESHLYNDEMQPRLVVVVHMFKGVAYWQLTQANLFVDSRDDRKIPFGLFEHLNSANALNTFRQFDVVVGLGLESNTKTSAGNLSRRRAAFLCSGLFAIVGGEGSIEAAGLDIGKYQGTQFKAPSPQELEQRSVIFVGLEVADPTVDLDSVLDELLSGVTISGVDLGLYSNFREVDNLQWITQSECRPDFKFMQ